MSIDERTALFTELSNLRNHLNLSQTLLRFQILLDSVPLRKCFFVFNLLKVRTHLGECLEDQCDCSEGFEVGCGGLLGQLTNSFDVKVVDLVGVVVNFYANDFKLGS